MFKTISYHYKCNKNELKILRFLCHISKNVYNVALYELRQSYIDTKTNPTYFDLNKISMMVVHPSNVSDEQINSNYNSSKYSMKQQQKNKSDNKIIVQKFNNHNYDRKFTMEYQIFRKEFRLCFKK